MTAPLVVFSTPSPPSIHPAFVSRLRGVGGGRLASYLVYKYVRQTGTTVLLSRCLTHIGVQSCFGDKVVGCCVIRPHIIETAVLRGVMHPTRKRHQACTVATRTLIISTSFAFPSRTLARLAVAPFPGFSSRPSSPSSPFRSIGTKQKPSATSESSCGFW